MNSGSINWLPRIAGRLSVTVMALALAACGGGGGSAGTNGTSTTGTGSTGTTGTGTGTVATPTLPSIKLALLNGTTATTSISASGTTTAQATVLDEKGTPVANKLITFSGDAALIKLSPVSGAVLTNSAGVATIQLAPASLASAGAGSLSVTSSISPSTGAAALVTTAALDYQLSAANLTLSGLNVGAATPLAAYGNRTVSVVANINGAVASNTPVQVTFSATCGTVTPATVTTDGTGSAASTYTANSTGTPGCAGANVSITAAATGATTQSASIAVQATQATNIQFVSASPQLIYLKGSVGATQSQVAFKVVDSSGNALSNQALDLSLTNTGTGVTLGTVGNTTAVSVTSDGNGVASVPVFSGSIPTSIQVNAVLVSNNTVSTKSNILKVASGVPVQKATSTALTKFSIEGLNDDGVTSDVTLSLADRQGNPVPVGTAVNFTTSAGVMVPATCTVPALADGTSSSRCVSTIRSSGTRPLNGRVVILAYTPGEEDFVDANFNNVYDAGEAFSDLGNAYRDDDLSVSYTTGEFSVPRAGTSTCAGGTFGRPDTCDGVWEAIDVRGQTTVVFANGFTHFSATSASLAGVSFTIADDNANTAPPYSNSLPTGTTIAVVGRSHTPTGSCTVTAQKTQVVNTIGPTAVSAIVGPTCTVGDFADITITSPSGRVTALTLTIQ